MERVTVYVDGGNFYHLVIKKLGIEENQFDFDAFARLLINSRTADEGCKRFYKGSVREKEGMRVARSSCPSRPNSLLL